MGCSVSKQEEVMMRFSYCWMNLETYDSGEKTDFFVNYLDFLNKISEFNRKGGIKWKYWAK